MKNEEQFNVKHRNRNYEIQNFLSNHPGGINYVRPYKDKDITKRMEDTQHSKAAYYLLREYKDNGRDETSTDDTSDLEKLVDWNKPMLSQVASLGNKYIDWVVLPVDRKLRLFENPILESLTITPWYVVPIVWIPIITYFIYMGINKYVELTKDESPTVPSVLSLFVGIIIWTLIEYSLHRWIFHMKISGNSKILIYIHFAIHGLHHKVPFDPKRLVFPPLPAAGIAFALYHLVAGCFPEYNRLLVFSGGLTGYVIYDMIHFYLHYGAPKENTYLYNLKRYHNHHHFHHHDNGYGISSMAWDIVFGTTITLKKLSFGIKW
ncbi:hypothetical protein WA026_019114 [Henosepilachna vigintioctopunctata]|uniref:Fatty acid 2-hydroxylase n=1 Tax=Henosepilachna vigintioctopunctata TaxID=420089 RepID=A0AAW1VG45_9CUCU